MDRQKQQRLEAAGFQVGDAGDFLGLSDAERRLVQLRLEVGRAVRTAREKAGVTQQQLAARLKSSQSRIAKIEAAAPDVTLDLSIRALFAVGGDLSDLVGAPRPRKQKPRRAGRTPPQPEAAR